MRRVYAGLVVIAGALAGCDPTSGLADTADAALPPVKRYFDGAGTPLVEGPWNRVVVDLDADTQYHVGARRLDDDEPTFHLFGADAQSGCQVAPNAGTWLMGKPDEAPNRLLPFAETLDERGRGPVRFTTLDCEVQDLVIEDGGRPYPRLFDHGYLIPTKQGYTFADPWAGESREIAERLERTLVQNEAVLLFADGKLKSFSDQFEPAHEWGNAVESVVQIRGPYLVEDADGLHRVTFDHDSLEIVAEDVLPGACHLQYSGATYGDATSNWVVLEEPCGNPRPKMMRLDATTFESLSSFEIPFEADARHARALISGELDTGERQPLGLLYVTDVDERGLGTLWAWLAGSPLALKVAERALLDGVFPEPPGSAWAGTAQTNYQQLGGSEAYDLIHFRWDGTTEVIAERIVRNSANGEVLINFDGVAADLPQFSEDGYRILATAVAPYTSTVTSFTGERHYARVAAFDGTSGQVLLGTESQDPTAWESIASGVTPESPRFAWFMPALLFIEDWDADERTGALTAYNYELDARTTIAEGVSSFDLTSYPWEGVIYTVPKGESRGIWFSRAK
ncbi:MAG TPA: hypothetical protein VHP33_20350 [Polyangiaceae bacterium]|nr:hypothetical protein [Polyangiaceae bacterium]